MSTPTLDEPPGGERSAIACHSCQKRKIRCSRKIPHCFDCQLAQRPCSYPERVRKPGPKVGSVRKKPKRTTACQQDDHTGNNSPFPDENERNTEGLERVHPRSQRSRSTSSPRALSTSSATYVRQSKDVQRISFIIHPSHESCSPQDALRPSLTIEPSQDHETLLSSICIALNITPFIMEKLIDVFHQSFTSFCLFRESSFLVNLRSSESDTPHQALIAAMIAFAVKAGRGEAGADVNVLMYCNGVSEFDFINLAISYADKSIAECGDEPPPLRLLQALILITDWLLAEKVCGRAWRYLGVCVRFVYEMNIHNLDAGKDSEVCTISTDQWCSDEECRRAWWAIWEMDVFASTLFRRPPAIDPNRNQVLLPIENEMWNRGQFQRSCLLEVGFMARFKALEAIDSRSPKAWFIALHSLMLDAYNISSALNAEIVYSKSGNPVRATASQENLSRELFTRLEVLLNSLRYCTMVMPSCLKFNSRYLDFGARTRDRNQNARVIQHHATIYSVSMMIEVTKLMALKSNVFRAGLVRRVRMTGNSVSQGSAQDKTHPINSLAGLLSSEGSDRALRQYFEAADCILNIVQNSHDNHYRYVNPFLANASWMAAAVQLVRRELTTEKAAKDLVDSKFELLRATHHQFVAYWNMSKIPQDNLDILSAKLGSFAVETRVPLGEARSKKRKSSDLEPGAQRARGPGSKARLRENRSWLHTPSLQKKLLLDGSIQMSDANITTSTATSDVAAHDYPFGAQIAQTPPSTRPYLEDDRSSSLNYTLSQNTQTSHLTPPASVESRQSPGFAMLSNMPKAYTVNGLYSWNDAGYPPAMALDDLNAFNFTHDMTADAGMMSHYLEELFSGSCAA